MPFIGKVRKDFGGIQTSSDLPLSTSSEKLHFIAPSYSGDISVMGDHKGLWRKGSSNVKPVVADIAPALSLNFYEEMKHPAQVITNDRSSLPPKSARRGSPTKKPVPTTPSPAAAFALAATSKSSTTSPEARLKYHQNARLTVKQATELLQMCSQEIKMRGLDTLGIFRPFRATESMDRQERLVELFLMYIDPQTYKSAFSLYNGEVAGSSLLDGSFEDIDAEVDLRKKLSSANINDVVSLFKWGLRRLRLQPADLKSFSQYTWYEEFLIKERDWKYPLKAYSNFLLPNLPSDTQLLLNTVLDLMSSISAHHIANAMSASKLCKILGFWLFGRVGIDHPPQDLRNLAEAWETSARVLEHLLLAYIRDQSTIIHLMPSRSMKIIADYPNLGLALRHKQLTQRTPCLSTKFTALPNRALFVEVQSENIIVSSLRPRSPRDTLRAALKAQGNGLPASEVLDDWNALSAVASHAASSALPVSRSFHHEATHGPQGDDADLVVSRQESSLFTEEDARVMQVVSTELERKKAKGEVTKPPLTSSLSQYASRPELIRSRSSHLDSKEADVGGFRFSAQSSQALFGLTASQSSPAIPIVRPKKSSLRPRPSLAHMHSASRSVDAPSDNLDWNTFASEGFDKPKEDASGGEVKGLDLELNQAFNIEMPPVKRQTSMGPLRRHKTSAAVDPSITQDITSLQAPTHTLKDVSLMALDETFIVFWQDQLLDDCIAARLPYMVVANLNKLTAGRLIGPDDSGTPSSCTKLLLISETVIPPRPPKPRSGSSRPGRTSAALRRRNTSTANEGIGEEEREAEKRSLFAPSIRSNWTASVSKTKDGLKKIGSIMKARRSSIDQTRDR